MIWEGRELGELLTADSKMVYYEYDANGLRTSKTVDGTKTEYVWLGDMLIREQTGTNVTYYLYDENGAAIGFEYNGTPYYYLKNIQGDVLSIVDNSGAIVVNYTYNAWGEIISTTGTLASTIGAINKLRYRSYYYDTETGFYYLQSRYYDPIVKRFISPDSTDYLTANGDFDGFNLYAYCVNNPVVNVDYSGESVFVNVIKYIFGVETVTAATYRPKYNRYYTSWNSAMSGYNCYAYAIRRPELGLLRPGEVAKLAYKYHLATLASHVRADLKKLAYQSKFVPYSYKPASNETMIALRIGSGDFHFMRRMSDGSWTHKPGQTTIIRLIGNPWDYNPWVTEYYLNHRWRIASNQKYDSAIVYIVFWR